MYRRLRFAILLCMFLSICQLVSAADVTTRNLVARGNIQYRQLNYANALAKYDDAIERDSKYALAHNNRGLALHKLSKLEEAADAIRNAIQLDADEAAFHLNLGKIYATAKDYDLALDEFEEALELDPGMTEAIYNKVWVLDEQGEFLKAAGLAQELLEMDGRPPGTDMLNGIVSAHDGDANDLVAACLRPDDLPQIWRWLSDINHSLGTGGNKEMSEEEILGLREAMRLISTEQFSQAREQLITVTSLANQASAQSPIPYWLMAMSWLLEDNEEKADEEMEKAADLMARVFLPESDSQMELIINEDNVGSAPVEMSYLPGSYLVQVRESGVDDPQLFTGIISLNAATYHVIDPSKLTLYGEPPLVSDIPDQTITVDGAFTDINLDSYVSDPDTTDAEITWTYTGNNQLIVNISDERVVTIVAPTDWFGSETITFTATDPDGLNDSDIAVFTLNRPVLSISPGELDFGTDTSESRFTIRNTGTEVLEWELTSDILPDWLRVSPESGELAAGKDSSVYLYIDRSLLVPGPYTYTINVTSNGGNGQVALTVEQRKPTKWYVSMDGNNENKGDSWNSAKLTIQAAINVASAGDVIEVAAGTYNETISFKNGIDLLGQGSETTRIEYGGNRVVINANQIDHGKISGFTIAYTGSEEHAAILLKDSSIAITDNVITGATLSNLEIRDSSDPQVLGNEIKDGEQTGIFIHTGARGTISGNTIYSNGYSGVSIKKGANPQIENNDIRNNTHNGVYVYEDGLGTISGNTIYSNGYSGVSIKKGSNPQVKNNDIRDNTQNGVYVYEGGLGTISGNTIYSNGYSGVSIKEESNPQVKNNDIRDNTHNGVYVYEGGLGTISGNTIYSNGYSGVSIKKESNPQVKNNDIRNNTQNGIFVYEEGLGTVSGNIIYNNGYRGLLIREKSSPQVIHNTIVGNKLGGIWIYSEASPVIRNNIVVKNEEVGIDIIVGGLPEVSFNDVWSNGSQDYNGMTKPVTDLSVDPLFVDIAANDYHLQPNSPCRGAADNGGDLGAYSSQASSSKILSISSMEAAPGSSISIQISINDIAGIAGGDIVITYDKDILMATGTEETTLSSMMLHSANINNPGEVVLAMVVKEAITGGSGALISIIFTVDAGAETNTVTTLKLEEAKLYDELLEEIPVDTQDGKVTISSGCVKGDVNNDGEIKSNDAIKALRFSAELEDPTPMEKCAADMNDDGQIRPNDAIIILRIVAGLAAPGSSVVASVGKQTTITLNEAHGVVGESIKIPVWFDNTDILAGGDVRIAYDSSVLRATGVSTDSGVLLASNLAEPGAIRIAFAYARGLPSRMLAEIQFDILADDVSPLEFKSVELYDSYALPINPRKIGGQFSSWAIPPENNDLLQNYPNPFNPDTWIPYQLKEGADVTIRIYSATGQLVKELYLGYKPAGLYVSSDRASYWDGKNEAGEQVASGVYFYSIQAGEFTAVKKLLVLK